MCAEVCNSLYIDHITKFIWNRAGRTVVMRRHIAVGTQTVWFKARLYGFAFDCDSHMLGYITSLMFELLRHCWVSKQ